MSSSFYNLDVRVLDVNFINPYKTAGFLSFYDKEDTKKTDNSVVEVKGCHIHSVRGPKQSMLDKASQHFHIDLRVMFLTDIQPCGSSSSVKCIFF